MDIHGFHFYYHDTSYYHVTKKLSLRIKKYVLFLQNLIQKNYEDTINVFIFYKNFKHILS